MRKILFVCTGNICRSCMAEGLFNHLRSEMSEPVALAESAGTHAITGQRATDFAVHSAKSKWDVDISVHRSRNLSELDLEQYFLILTMTKEHMDYILMNYPNFRDRVFLLGAPDEARDTSNELLQYEIDDPYGFDQKAYDECADRIEKCIRKVMANLITS